MWMKVTVRNEIARDCHNYSNSDVSTAIKFFKTAEKTNASQCLSKHFSRAIISLLKISLSFRWRARASEIIMQFHNALFISMHLAFMRLSSK